MKKLVAIGIIFCFLAAGCTPAAMRAAALGGTLGTAVVLGVSSHFRDRTSISAKKDVDIEHVKASAASNARNACGGFPCENGYFSDTAGGAIVQHTPIVQPIAQNVQSVRPLVSHKNGSGGESALCRAGREAALKEFSVACEPNDNNEYCLCYEAATKGR